MLMSLLLYQAFTHGADIVGIICHDIFAIVSCQYSNLWTAQFHQPTAETTGADGSELSTAIQSPAIISCTHETSGSGACLSVSQYI
jgi:hypothetical protein